MRKLLIPICLILFVGSAYASRQGLFTAGRSYPSIVVCSTSTATSLFTNDGEIELIGYDNQSTYDIFLATFPATSITNTSLYNLKAGGGLTYIPSTSFNYAISSGTASQNLHLLIIK